MDFLLLALMPLSTSAVFWRLPCLNPSGIGRLDPIVTPGMPSEHVHVIFGAQKFGFSANADELISSACTSCSVVEDKSAYWVPALYFTSDNQTYEMVPRRGGLTVYYFMNRYANASSTFPSGFRMLSGDNGRRSITIPIPDPPMASWSSADMTEDALRQKAIGFNCLGNSPVEGSLERHFLPDKEYIDAHCLDGLRLELMFPSCWDGVNLDSTDHRSHVAFPSLLHDGNCPDSFPVRLPTLLYELAWDTEKLSQVSGTFKLANGDSTGLSYHGDFMSGWNPVILQYAGDVCTDPDGQIENCKAFNLLSSGCNFLVPAELSGENVIGPRIGLPGQTPLASTT